MKRITAITNQQQAQARRRAWEAALHDASNLITPMARRRNLKVLEDYTGTVDLAARNLLADGGGQQGVEGLDELYDYSLTRYSADVQTLVDALSKETS